MFIMDLSESPNLAPSSRYCMPLPLMFSILICSIGASSDSLVQETSKGEVVTTWEDVEVDEDVEGEVSGKGDEEVAGLAASHKQSSPSNALFFCGSQHWLWWRTVFHMS